MEIKKTPLFNKDIHDEWFIPKEEIPEGGGLMAYIKRGPQEFTQENFIKAMEATFNRKSEPQVWTISAGILLAMDDESFKMFFNSDQIRCLTGTDGYNKINWRAYKLKLIDKYEKI